MYFALMDLSHGELIGEYDTLEEARDAFREAAASAATWARDIGIIEHGDDGAPVDGQVDADLPREVLERLDDRVDDGLAFDDLGAALA